MKRYGNLWLNLASFEALLDAAEQARKGKRFRPAVAAFHFDQERALWKLHEELTAKTYRPGAYRSFFIYEPKERQISAAPYRDRVVHHALTAVLEPIFERTFIADSYACRKGKGTHAAVRRSQEFTRRFRYVLKADIQKFFPSMDHEILKARVARKIKDRDVLWLVDRIIDGSNPQEEVLNYFPGDDLFTPGERRRGIPIGNQTSQFFSNVYLDRCCGRVHEEHQVLVLSTFQGVLKLSRVARLDLWFWMPGVRIPSLILTGKPASDVLAGLFHFVAEWLEIPITPPAPRRAVFVRVMPPAATTQFERTA